MVRVVVVEPAEDEFRLVDLVVAVFVLEQDEAAAALREVDALGRELEADGQVQVVGEDRLLVRLAAAGGVFQDNQLVVGPRVARPVVGIGRHDGDPEAALVVEGHLDRLDQIRKFLLARKLLDLVARRQLERGQRFLFVQELDPPALGLEVGLDGRERRGCGVERGDVERLALERRPDRLVADRGHLADLLDLERIVCGTEGVVALAVRMHAVGDLEIVDPEPVLLQHGLEDGRAPRFGLYGGLAEDAVDQERRQPPVARVVQQRAVRGQRLA